MSGVEKNLQKRRLKNRNCCIFSFLGFAFGLKQKRIAEPGAWSPVYFGPGPLGLAILIPETRSPKTLWDLDKALQKNNAHLKRGRLQEKLSHSR